MLFLKNLYLFAFVTIQVKRTIKFYPSTSQFYLRCVTLIKIIFFEKKSFKIL